MIEGIIPSSKEKLPSEMMEFSDASPIDSVEKESAIDEGAAFPDCC
jgi:hypothetical protein